MILMLNTNILFWIGVVILASILIIAISGILKAIRDSHTSLTVACAGSIDNSYPDHVSVKMPKDFISSKIKTDLSTERPIPFLVKGNSMQYANIHSDDIIFVVNKKSSELNNILPKVTLLSFTPGNNWSASHKIRRTWMIEKASIEENCFRNSMRTILASPLFEELRNELRDKCPSDEVLMEGAVRSLRKYKEKNQQKNKSQSGDELILISTTYRTERERLEFSIHPSSSLQGVVTSVIRRTSVTTCGA